MTFAALTFAALAVLPSDRMAMADRLFDRGDWAGAKAEYVALKGSEGIAADEPMYRLAECERLGGNSKAARAAYSELLDGHPLSRHADRARLMKALAGTDDEKKSELRLLDSDKVKPAVRAAALYHYGVVAKDRAALERCVKLDPKGPYALYAKFHHASLVAEDPDPAVRRTATSEFIEIQYGPDKELAREAVYFAAERSYRDKRYGEASTLFRRYLKAYPDAARANDARTKAAWCDYLVGKYADAASLCGEGRTDDSAYLLAACAYGSGDLAKAKELMTRYLEDYPHGKYRAAVELPLARMAFDAAEKSSDTARTIEAAKRSVALSKNPQDRIRLAWAYEKGGMTDEAVAEYSGVAKDFPGTESASEALFRKAMIDIRAGKWSSAELALSESLSKGCSTKRKPEALYWRGIAATRLGHAAEGIEALKEALNLGISLDQSREARLVLADADFKAGKLAEAKSEYAKLVREGATERMSAAKMRSVGRFLLECQEGEGALEEVKTCAKALAEAGKSPEWRQAAFALLGAAEEAAGEFEAAIGSYRQAMAEDVRTDESRLASLRLGVLLSKAGEHSEAEKSLKEAVALNAGDSRRRAEAYLWLAKNCEAASDFRGACGYATVLVSLFEGDEAAEEAKKMLAAHPEEAR